MENVVHLPTETATAPVMAFDPLSTAGLILQGEGFQRMEKIAELMAGGSATIPKHLHNKADCFAVVMQSMHHARMRCLRAVQHGCRSAPP